MSELFQNVLTASFHGSIVITAVFLLRPLLKKTPKKFLCFLWMLAFIRLLMPFEIRSDFSLQPEPVAVVQEQQTLVPTVPDFLEPEVIAQMEAQPRRTEVQNFAQNGVTVEKEDVPAEPSVSAQPQISVQPEKKSIDWLSLIPFVWLGVSALFVLYCIYSYVSLKLRVREAIKIPGGWECDRIETAFILGFIRPKIYIPMGLPGSVRKHILAHERTHLEKGDHWFKMIGYIALAIHWFNPLVWLAYILLCKDIELACDERVVQFMELEERKSYSKALLSCSTNRAHFAACPVAFGEVSVKERIKTVLNYRKPSFWISLLGVIAIIFVTVCLMTSPEEADPVPEDVSAEDPAQSAEDTERSGFTAELSQDDIVTVCEKAIADLKNRDSYYIRVSSKVESTNEHYVSGTSVSEIRRHGENKLSETYEDGQLIAGGAFLNYGDQYAMFYGDKWAWEEDSLWNSETDVDEWLDDYSPAGKDVSFPEGTGIVGGDAVSFHATWSESPYGYDQNYSGTFTYIFRDGGILQSIVKIYVYPISEEDGGGEVYYTRMLNVVEETTAETAAVIEGRVNDSLTQEELNDYRLLQDQVTEIPSNKTSYDKDFMLGSGQMGWKFMKGEWFFKFGAEDVTPTSAKLVIEYNGQYGNNTVSHGTVEAGAAYFIEELVDGTWVEVPVISDTFQTVQPKVLDVGITQTINWEANYGALPGGFYRIGNYYTFTSDTGETDVQACYAKFRIYDENHEVLLSKAKSAIEALENRDNYHLYNFDWLTEHDYEYYLCSEVWKHGPDYLEVTKYPLREDMTQMSGIRGSMWRDGKYYGLTWGGEPVESEITEWWKSVDGYMDDSNFSMWSWDYEWYDANVELVYQEGNTIHIVETYDFDDKYECTEIVLTFDDNDNLVGIINCYLPERNSAQKDKVISKELVVFDSTATEIAETISSQDISEPMPFSYAEDAANNPDAQTSGFKNTTAKPITTAADAVARADRESVLPQLMEFETGYCQTMTYHDEEAGIWKVHMFWWQHDTAQTVYMTDDGITQMIVVVE